MAKEGKNTTGDTMLALEATYTKAEKFVEDHQKNILIVVGAIVVLVGGYFGYNNLYSGPREKEAQAQLFPAQQYFERDSFKLALNGDGNNLGVVRICDDYSSTQAGNLAAYYAGICYLKTGEFQKAIDYLEKFSADDEFVGPIAKGAMGDCYMELGKTNEAIDNYELAAKMKDNDLTTPMFLMKEGIACELKGDFKKALECYNTIKDKYKKSMQAGDIDKYIARAEFKTK